MSLLIWAPLGRSPSQLSGTLSQNGTAPMTLQYINNSGAIVERIGGKVTAMCYSREYTERSDLFRTSAKLPSLPIVTMCCWAYVIETIGDTANGLISNHSHADCSGLGITVKQVSSSDYRISCSTGDGTNRTYCSYYGTTNIKEKWCHLALTHDGTTVRLYVNGVLEVAQNCGNKAISDYFDMFNWSTTYYTEPSYRPKCRLNDVRLYNEVLSANELHEIAKGLTIHVPCNQPWRSPNLFNIKTLNSYEPYNSQPTVLSYGEFSTTFNTSYSGSYIAIQTGYSYSGGVYTFSGYIKVNGKVPEERYITGYMSTYGSNLIANDYDATSGFFRITQNMPEGTTWDIHCPTIRPAYSSDVITFSNFKIEIGEDPVPRWSYYEFYMETTEYDTSGFVNDGYSLRSACVPRYYGDQEHGASYYFTNTDFISVCPYVTYISECTISFWAKIGSCGTSGWLPLSGTSNLEYVMASINGTGDFYNGSRVTGDPRYYADGKSITKPILDSKWHHYCITGISLTNWGNLFLNNYTGAEWDSTCWYSDVRVYTTTFSDDEAKRHTSTPVSFIKINNVTYSKAVMLQGELIETHFTNMIDNVNDALYKGVFENGVSGYEQEQCHVSISSGEYRIFRTKNINPSANGYVMWGGFCLHMIDKLTKGHTYVILFDVRGKSTNTATSWGFTNQMGWGGGGLDPTPSNVSSCNIGTNFNGEKTCWYKFTIKDDLYKTCTYSYSGFVEGNVYPSYRDFMFGFGYEDTGDLGTELYLSNLRLYDITHNLNNVRITKNGNIDISNVSERFSTDIQIGKFGNVNVPRDIIEY